MGSAGDGYQGLPGGAGFVVFPAHAAGDEIVRLAVEEDHGYPDPACGFQSGVRLQVKAAEDPCAQLHEGIGEPGRQLHGPDHLPDDIPGGGETTVSQHADDIFRQFPAGGHQHRGGTHGDTGEDDPAVRPEPADREVQPVKTVPVFPDAEGDGSALTAAAAPLIHDQGASAQGEAPVHTAGQVPLRVAPITVEHQLDGGAGGIFVVFSVEGQSVEGCDGQLLLGQAPGPFDPVGHLLPEGGIFLAVGEGNGLRVRIFGPDGEKCHPVAQPGNEQSGQRGHNCRGNDIFHRKLPVIVRKNCAEMARNKHVIMK